ncbi:hypothetical protein BMS3Abin05_01015 [bacterium BMS3Abin05]|nr:hypothetical protein BMS3Abin05_01015 [bacterium BMS3Abin05]GBE27833.1 hypothetical protein BMS3Bbin03_01763 [bacterium BMS3Bbin03]HDZ11406.1 PorV/PorQ family protein [Bacteroidota bacterium]
MRKVILLVMTLWIFPGILFSQIYVKNVSKVGTTSAPFLEIGIGARAIGMGGAFVALANDASAMYWNPGGLAKLKNSSVLLEHSEWLAGINFDYTNVILKLGELGTIGGSITSLTMADQIVRTVDRPEGTGERYSAGDLAVGLSYARSLTDRFSIGFNAKYIHQKIWHMTASAFAIDFGTLFITQFRGLRIGASLSNFGTNMRLDGRDILVYHDIDPRIMGNNPRIPAELKTDSWALPLLFRLGVAMDVLNNAANRLTLAVDAQHPSDNAQSLNVGSEYAFRNFFMVRIGYKSLFLQDGEEGLTFGAGLKQSIYGMADIQVDYAFANFGRLKNIQKFSLQILF